MRSLLILCLVPICLGSITLTPEYLASVFGTPGNVTAFPDAQYPALAQPSSLSANSTSSNVDYLDSMEKYAPSQADYDKFDWTLTKRLASSSEENFLISPLGLKLALAILAEAATGSTQRELDSVLGFDLDKNTVRQKFSKILSSLHQTDSPQHVLKLGSRIYIGDRVEPRQRFAAIAEEFYKTELKNLDFTDSVAAANIINNWVSNVTEGRIPNLVEPDDVTGVVVLVLNTLFFKGTWSHQFFPNATRKDLFFLNATHKKELDFMNVKNKFYFSESSKYNAKILRMPYTGNKFAMYIIVPESISGLPKIFADLNDLRAELHYLQQCLVDVTLPKFQFEYTSVLDGVLRELGIRQAFEDTASFPGIARGQALSQKIKISRVLQRSGIEVNELGSVAYSATEVSLVNKFGGGSEAESVVIANKPFLFFIQDEATRQLLFTGRVSDPSLPDGAFKLT